MKVRNLYGVMSKKEERRQILQINNDLDTIYEGEGGHPGVLHSIEAIVRQCEGQTDAKYEICRILMRHSGVMFDLQQSAGITSEFIIAYFGAFLKQTFDGQPAGTGPVNANNDVAVRQIRDKLILIYQEVKMMYDELVRSSTARAPRTVSNARLSQMQLAQAEAIELQETRARGAAARAARASMPRVRAPTEAIFQPSPFTQLHFPSAATQEQIDTERIRDHFEQRRQHIEDQHRLVGHPHVAQFLDSIFVPSDDENQSDDAMHDDLHVIANYPRFMLKRDQECAAFDEQYALRLAAERRKNHGYYEAAGSMQY